MQAFDPAARAAIQTRLKEAQRREALAIVSELCGEELIAPPTSNTLITPRFTVTGDVVYDSLTDLSWTRAPVTGGRRNWADSMKAASECRIAGCTDWRAPTIQQRLSIVDYTRINPAIDISAFECEESGWEWTATPYASSPSGCAWYVYFNYGNSYWYFQDYDGFVRAVRPGQIVGQLG